jgi:hypothetical protein
VASIDMSTNSIEGITIEKMPTFAIYKKGMKNKPPVKYDGPMEVASLKRFVREHTHKEDWKNAKGKKEAQVVTHGEL